MSSSDPMSHSESPATSNPTGPTKKPSKSKALERRCQMIHEW
jgi:hypothetical protein